MFAVMELNHVGARIEQPPGDRQRFFHRGWNLARGKLGFEAGPFARVGAAHMSDTDPCPGASDTAVIHGVAMNNGKFLSIADIDDRSDALMKIQLAEEPAVIGLIVPKSRKHPFSRSVEHLRAVRHLNLTGLAHRRNPVADKTHHRPQTIAGFVDFG